MKRLTIVDSSMVHAVGYDRETKSMEVIFHSGHIYEYRDVPYRVYLGLFHTDSIGEYMKAEIIGVYVEQRVSSGGRRKL
jgi:hypothetical protein